MFSASAVLIYATIESPLAQPRLVTTWYGTEHLQVMTFLDHNTHDAIHRCLVGGHILSALVGVTVEKIITALAEATGTDVLDWRSTGCAVAVACAITVMQVSYSSRFFYMRYFIDSTCI